MTLLAEHGQLLIILACVFGLFMAWGVGANDVANAMGTSVGSRALTVKQAILIAMVFEFAGAYLAGGAVTDTVRKGIIDPSVLANSPELLVFGMMSALLAAGTWLMLASIMGWPVSTTHSIVGAMSALRQWEFLWTRSIGAKWAISSPVGSSHHCWREPFLTCCFAVCRN
jgi:PiT family inorganic phosphate transporter